jgi:hypothetical protein
VLVGARNRWLLEAVLVGKADAIVSFANELLFPRPTIFLLLTPSGMTQKG